MDDGFSRLLITTMTKEYIAPLAFCHRVEARMGLVAPTGSLWEPLAKCYMLALQQRGLVETRSSESRPLEYRLTEAGLKKKADVLQLQRVAKNLPQPDLNP